MFAWFLYSRCVPLGSELGPLLFDVCVTDHAHYVICVTWCTIVQYADNTIISLYKSRWSMVAFMSKVECDTNGSFNDFMLMGFGFLGGLALSSSAHIGILFLASDTTSRCKNVKLVGLRI